MNIKFLDLKKNYDSISEEVNLNIQKVLNKCNYIHGSEVTEFENNFASYIGTKHCIGVANCTDALEIAVHSLKLKENDEILVQGNTCMATCLAVVNNNLKLVITDCDEKTNIVDIESIKSKLTSKTKAIIVVHMYGIMPNMDEILEICEKHNIILIEDCAQASGAIWDNKRAGSFGKLSCFSFYPGKNLGAYGDGGAICTNDDELANNIRKYANLGTHIKYKYDIVGRNSRLDTFHATVLNTKLKYLDKWNEQRRHIADIYFSELKDIPDIILPVINDKCLAIYHLFVIKTKYRKQLKAHLDHYGIETLIHYPISITETDALKDFNLEPALNCINNSKQILSLPMYPELTNNEVLYICDKIKLFYSLQTVIPFESFNSLDKPGTLNALNNLPFEFDLRRCFFINNFDREDTNTLDTQTQIRGYHSHNNCRQFFIVMNGSVKLKTIFSKDNIKEYTINTGQAYLINYKTWIEFEILDQSTLICVLADKSLNVADSVYNFDAFLNTTY